MISKKQNPETRQAEQVPRLSVLSLAKRHPLLTSVFAFWGFGYTFMVPNLLGGRFLFAFFKVVGKSPGDAFLGFSLLFGMVILFAGVVPFLIWYLVCRALESGESSSPLSQ
ncbi:MAG: hypothetical protein ACYC9S_02165 [Leptospirales bacterium]